MISTCLFYLLQDINSTLNALYPATISFNPITANSIAKALQRIAGAEGYELAAATASVIAEASDGDVRSAIQSLQVRAYQHARQSLVQLFCYQIHD